MPPSLGSLPPVLPLTLEDRKLVPCGFLVPFQPPRHGSRGCDSRNDEGRPLPLPFACPLVGMATENVRKTCVD